MISDTYAVIMTVNDNSFSAMLITFFVLHHIVWLHEQ